MSVAIADFGFSEDETRVPLSSEFNRISMIEAYQEVFLNSLYEEQFSYSEVDDLLREYEEELDYEGVVAVDGDDIVGFAFGYGLDPRMNNEQWRSQHDFRATDTEEDVLGEFFGGDTYYFAELGVIPDYRGRHLGKDMKAKELERVRENDDFERALMRTNQDNVRKIEGIDKPLGFQVLPWKTEVEQERGSGTVETDTRIWMSRDV